MINKIQRLANEWKSKAEALKLVFLSISLALKVQPTGKNEILYFQERRPYGHQYKLNKLRELLWKCTTNGFLVKMRT